MPVWLEFTHQITYLFARESYLSCLFASSGCPEKVGHVLTNMVCGAELGNFVVD